MNTTRMITGASMILDGLAEYCGIQRDDKNFEKTPQRMIKALLELCNGADDFVSKSLDILNTSFPDDTHYDEMVYVDNVFCAGVCPHHLVPVEYVIHVAYIPGEKNSLVGISKLARIAALSASRPVMQEVVTKDILDCLMTLHPLGAGVYVAGRHGCMRLRGAKQHMSTTKTTAFHGVFKTQPETRAEFMGMVHESNSSRL